jgi:phospholipid/cholesterol/gamma-HCH transport system substrate-binding protein
MTNADVLISGINNVIKKTQEDLKVSLSELSQTMIQFRQASTSVNVMLDDKSANKNVVTNFNKVSGDFAQISDSIKSGLRKKP